MIVRAKKFVAFFWEHKTLAQIFLKIPILNGRLFFPLQHLLMRELLDSQSVLDLGCGRHSMVPIIPSKVYTLGVELFKPALDEALAKKRHTAYIHADLTKISFPENSFDAVVLLDVIEHLSKEEGESLIEKASRWAKKKVIIFTPNGFLHQEEYDENPLMKHRSGWEVNDLEKKGFRVFGVRGFKNPKREEFESRSGAWRFLNGLSDMGQILTYYFPKSAFQLFAVRTR